MEILNDEVLIHCSWLRLAGVLMLPDISLRDAICKDSLTLVLHTGVILLTVVTCNFIG